MINIGPSHEFHGGQFLLFLGWYFTSTLEGRSINSKNCSLGYETCQKQEGDLVEETIKSYLSGPIARGWAILRDAEEFMEDYENSSSPNMPP